MWFEPHRWYIVVESAYLGVSYATLVRMFANVAVDVVGGSVPFVGTDFDAVWKTNKRNVDLLLADLGVERDDETDTADGTSGEAEAVIIEVEEPQ